MADSTSILAPLLLTANMAGGAAKTNDLHNAASPAMLFALDPSTTTGLDFGYIGGRFNSDPIASDVVTLAASDDNYIVADRSDGTVSVSQTTTNWNDAGTYMRLYFVVTDGSGITSYEDHRSLGGGGGATPFPKVLQVACSDQSTALTTGTAKITFRMPYAMTLNAGTSGVRASLKTAQATGSIFTVDINEGVSSILSTKITIDNTEKTSVTAATPVVISDVNLADDAEITIDIDQLGDGTAIGLIVTLIGT